MKKVIVFFISLFVFVGVSTAEKGILRGVITDADTGEAISFANVLISELGTGTTSDLDGNFSIELEEGTYNLVISFLGYASLTVKEVVIHAKTVNNIAPQLKEEGTLLEEVTVTATQLNNTEAAIATIKRRSSVLMDGVSAQTFSKIGDANAGEAIKRVAGVSIEGGKNVYVRGLGDRYTKTILNGMNIPGLDPDKNTVQMDIFPTNIIDNILVYKSFSPDLPADFSGGIVDIVTKDFPEEKSYRVSFSTAYNPTSNLKADFLKYKGSKTDIIGLDNGTRALGFYPAISIPDEALDNIQLHNLTRSFSPTLAATNHMSGLNSSFSFSAGNQKNIGKNTIGYIAAVNYKNSFTHYNDAFYGSFVTDENNQLFSDKTTGGRISNNNVLLSGLFGAAFKTKQHKFSLNYLRIQNGEDQSAKLISVETDVNPATVYKDVLHYTQRTVNSFRLSGKHKLNDGNLEILWHVSPTWIEVDEPDLRSTGFELTSDGEFLIRPSIGADISRSFRNLKESSYNGKVDIVWNYKQWLGLDSKLKFGVNFLQKERDYGIQSFLFRVKNQSSLHLEGDANRILTEENLWLPDTERGTYVKGNFEPANTFNAQQSVMAAYLMTELAFTHQLKAVLGARAEKVDNYYTGQNNLGTIKLTKENVLDELDVLPSLNLIYSPLEKMNIRFSYNKTLARPSFKEKSIAQIQDKVSNRTFIGNLSLVETKIQNLDLRWELFFSQGQLISVSGFYKNLTNPIELESYNELSPSDYTPRNQKSAEVYGVELEVKKDLSFLSERFRHFNIGGNASFIKSVIKREHKIALYSSENRQMVGQSPYLLNASLGYKNSDLGLEFNTSYNVQGARLFIVGVGINPDVYEQPFNQWDAKASKVFGHSQQWKISLSANNLLGSIKKITYDGGELNPADYYWAKYNPGRSFSMDVSLKF